MSLGRTCIYRVRLSCVPAVFRGLGTVTFRRGSGDVREHATRCTEGGALELGEHVECHRFILNPLQPPGEGQFESGLPRLEKIVGLRGQEDSGCPCSTDSLDHTGLRAPGGNSGPAGDLAEWGEQLPLDIDRDILARQSFPGPNRRRPVCNRLGEQWSEVPATLDDRPGEPVAGVGEPAQRRTLTGFDRGVDASGPGGPACRGRPGPAPCLGPRAAPARCGRASRVPGRGRAHRPRRARPRRPR